VLQELECSAMLKWKLVDVQRENRLAIFYYTGGFKKYFRQEYVLQITKKRQHYCYRFSWCGAGSNRRHKDFQSFALPTELPHQLLKKNIVCYCFKRDAKIRHSIHFQKDLTNYFLIFFSNLLKLNTVATFLHSILS
jgi:hypothetical protein